MMRRIKDASGMHPCRLGWRFLCFSDLWQVIKTQNKTITSNIFLFFFTRLITNNHKPGISYKNDLLQKP